MGKMIKKIGKKRVMTQGHQHSPVPTLKLSPIPSPSSCQVVPQPLGRAQLSKKRGMGLGGVWKGGFEFSRTKHHQKQLVQKMTELPPFHGLKIAKKK